MKRVSELLVENSEFFSAFDAPLGRVPLQYSIKFGTEKLEWCGEKMKICLLVSTEYTNVTDTRTDRQSVGQTPHDGINRAYA